MAERAQAQVRDSGGSYRGFRSCCRRRRALGGSSLGFAPLLTRRWHLTEFGGLLSLDGETPLYAAACGGFLQVLKRLVQVDSARQNGHSGARSYLPTWGREEDETKRTRSLV
jgi:hypothetical protein